MSKRSFAGYLCGESLSVGLFGECFQAENRRGSRARVTVVDERLSQRKRFATALARHGAPLADLVHPHIVTTEKVGKGKDGVLVLIASDVERPVELRTLVDRLGTLPSEISLSVAMGILQGLSHAHEHQVVHGGVHPRSVLVDVNGVTKLCDFGLAHALASAAAGADDSELLAGLRGYVAPELALGQEPDEVSDVYAAGALISWLLWNQQAPPEHEREASADVLRKALDTDCQRRFKNATVFETALKAALDAEGLSVAGPSQVSRFLTESIDAIDSGLDAETEDLLATLNMGEAPPSPGPASHVALEEALAGLSQDFLGLEDSVDDVDPNEITIANYGPEAESSDYEEELTTVDPDEQAPVPDPVEAIIRNNVAQPKIVSKSSSARSRLGPLEDYVDDDETPLPIPRPFHADGTHVGALVDLVGRQAATSSPFHDDEALPAAEKERSNTLRWLAIIAFVMAVLGAVAYTKTDRFGASKRDSDDDNNQALEEIEKMQPKPGQISILSDTEDAAVWLLLGRTPATSFQLPSSMVHEIRLEHEGYRGVFMSIAAQHWSGEESARTAVVSATLQPIGDAVQALPAFPLAADVPLTPGGAGQGSVKVESEPAGAEVWLWIGTTPLTNLTGIEAGKDYEFKVLKDGHRPAFAAVKSVDWYLSGEQGPTRPILERRVTLDLLPESATPGTVEATTDDGATGSKSRRRRKNHK